MFYPERVVEADMRDTLVPAHWLWHTQKYTLSDDALAELLDTDVNVAEWLTKHLTDAEYRAVQLGWRKQQHRERLSTGRFVTKSAEVEVLFTAAQCGATPGSVLNFMLTALRLGVVLEKAEPYLTRADDEVPVCVPKQYGGTGKPFTDADLKRHSAQVEEKVRLLALVAADRR